MSGCPGTAASSTSRSLSWVGPLAAAKVAEPGSWNHGSSTVPVNVALIQMSAVGLVRSSCCPKQPEGSLERSTKRCGSGGWPGPHLFSVLDFVFAVCSPSLHGRILQRHSIRNPKKNFALKLGFPTDALRIHKPYPVSVPSAL